MYKATGYMNAGAEFDTHAEVCNWFGHSFKIFRRAVAKHSAEPELVIWFPRLYENDEWETWSSDDDEIIYERKKEGNAEYVQSCLRRRELFKRLVFPAIRPGRYVFKGLYEIDSKNSLAESTITYRRTATRVKTYSRVNN